MGAKIAQHGADMRERAERAAKRAAEASSSGGQYDENLLSEDSFVPLATAEAPPAPLEVQPDDESSSTAPREDGEELSSHINRPSALFVQAEDVHSSPTTHSEAIIEACVLTNAELLKKYMRNGVAKQLKKNMINDDFCDCLNGVDEPGTNACAGVLPKEPVDERLQRVVWQKVPRISTSYENSNFAGVLVFSGWGGEGGRGWGGW